VITGTVTYGNAIGDPALRFVLNVLLSGAGSPPVFATTDILGTYSLSGFGTGAYTVTASKIGGQNDAVDAFDAALIAQHVGGSSMRHLRGNQLIVADVSGNGIVTSFDAAQIAGYVVQLPTTGSTGNWIFNPGNRTYTAVNTDITGEDYTALLMGEVSGNWNEIAPSPARFAIGVGPERIASAKLPQLVTPADSEVIIPVSVQGTKNKGIIAYEFDLRYDPSVIQPQANPVDLAGTLSSTLSAVANPKEPGLLRVAVYGTMPISGNGVLLNLRFTAVGAPGSVSPLTWERLMFNDGNPRTQASDGQVELSAAALNQAEITGRLLTGFGTGVPNSRVTLTDTAGQSQSILSNGFGVYRFGGLQDGQTYTIRVDSRRYRFTPLTVSVTGQSVSVDMIADQ
jgi:hypothetical protein